MGGLVEPCHPAADKKTNPPVHRKRKFNRLRQFSKLIPGHRRRLLEGGGGWEPSWLAQNRSAIESLDCPLRRTCCLPARLPCFPKLYATSAQGNACRPG